MKQKRRTKLNNAGMSLVEMIVVVLIIGILSAGAVAGLSFISSMDASSAAEEMMSLLERTKMNTLTADASANVTLRVIQDNNKYYGVLTSGGAEVDRVEIGSHRIKITVKEGATETVISDSSSYEFAYQKSNGAFNCGATSVVIEGSDTCTICLVNATGRSYMK